MAAVFYHSVIKGLGLFVCFMIQILHAQNNKARFIFVSLHSDKNMGFRPNRARSGSYLYYKYEYIRSLCVIESQTTKDR